MSENGEAKKSEFNEQKINDHHTVNAWLPCACSSERVS